MATNARNANKADWLRRRREDVKRDLRIEYESIAELARVKGVSGGLLRNSLSRPIPRGNRIIASALGKTVHDIWPEWYDEAGNPIHAKASRNGSCELRGHHRQNGAAA